MFNLLETKRAVLQEEVKGEETMGKKGEKRGTLLNGGEVGQEPFLLAIVPSNFISLMEEQFDPWKKHLLDQGFLLQLNDLEDMI